MRGMWGIVIVLALACVGCEGGGMDAHSGDAHEEGDGHEGGGPAGDGHEGHAEGGHAEEEGVVHLSPSTLARGGVRVAAVTMGAARGVVEVAAEVHLNPDRVAHISPLVEGQLLGVGVTLGDKVEVEQELAILRSVSLGQARADLSRGVALRDVARQNFVRQQRLRSEGINSERSLLEAQLTLNEANAEQEAARSRLQVFGVTAGSGPDMALSSPIQGVIIERHATRGENVAPSDTLFVVADLSRVWVIGRVYEQQIGAVAPGMEATLSLNAYPGRTWDGTVDFVGAVVDEATRTLPIRVELNNTDGMLRPGLFGTLRLSPSVEGGMRVVVPETAVQTMDDRSVVFVPGDEEGEFVVRGVTLGRSSQGQVEVLEGLERGGSVVVQGGFVLKSELMRGELGEGHAH